jgi:hypothetical protein
MKDEGWRSRLIERPRWHVGVEQRYCRLHPATRAVDRCDHCGEPYCAACLQGVERWRVCAGCLRLLQREERARRLPERLRRLRGQVVAAIGVLLVLTLIAVGLQALLRGASSDATMLQSAELVGNKLNGAPAPRLATLQVRGGLPAAHPPAGFDVTGGGFRPGEVVQVTAEVDVNGAVVGATKKGQAGVTELGGVTATAAKDGSIAVHFAVPNAAKLSAPYRIQVNAQGSRGTTGYFDLAKW